MDIVYRDERFFVIDKPEGLFVHPPEYSGFATPKSKICLYLLQDELGRAVFPVHRLDAPTSGLVLFTYDKDSTRELSRLFQDREMEKTYLAVARGHLEDEGVIDLPLEVKGFPEPNESATRYDSLARIEIDKPVGKKYPSARYTLLKVRPVTGRWHQIRRHFDRVSHPLLGDIEHGDSHHNRFFRDELGIRGLCLRAASLAFTHPWTGERIEISAPANEKWAKVSELFGYLDLGRLT